MKKISILVILFFFQITFLYSDSLVEMDVKPNKKIKNIKSLVLFHFDGKFINSQQSILIDYLTLSDDFYKYILDKFYKLNSLKIIPSEEKNNITEEDILTTIKNKYSPSFKQKDIVNREEIEENDFKDVDVNLYGKINKYYEGKTFDTSYIDITIYLVDSKSKIILWTSSIRGCLKYVAESLIGTISSGEYSMPTVKDENEFHWVNPYTYRINNWAIEYRIGYMTPIGQLADKISGGVTDDFSLYFKLPIWKLNNLYNQIELNVLPSFASQDKNDPIWDHTYQTYVPLFFNFIYNFYENKIAQGLCPSVKAGFGLSYIETYYSGLQQYKNPNSEFNAIVDIGLGIEYSSFIGNVKILGLNLNVGRLGVLGNFDFYHWFITGLFS